MLLLYHASMSTKSPRDWNEFEYKIQVALASCIQTPAVGFCVMSPFLCYYLVPGWVLPTATAQAMGVKGGKHPPIWACHVS